MAALITCKQVAARGDLEEFIRAFNAGPRRLCMKDTRGQTPLHVAAISGFCNIVDYIIEQNINLDTVDNEGDTALHCAVRNNHVDIIESLLDAGATSSITNLRHMAPLHIACDLGNLDALEAMLKKNVDTMIRGEGGCSPLHYCCLNDKSECARLLLKHGARPCQRCDMGYFPIHIAAKCASAQTLEMLIQESMKKGYDRATVMGFKDKENNMPLHAAVNGGNLKAVEVCLKAGALVDCQQDDKTTPLHLAAAQGNLDMITLMFELQTANFSSALGAVDAMKMTPLHRAALFNHVQVVEFLIRNGAEIDSVDNTSSTPLLLAASKGSWDSVLCLIQHGADIYSHDQNSRNFLHLAIRFGGKLHEFGCSFVESIKNLLNEKDKFGCTPLHYASKEGHLPALDDLIRFGAALSPKNNDKQSPFHFAARYGRYNTCRRLLESHQGPSIINETDADGLTGLHIAAKNGHTKILHLLLQKGAVINRDNDDNTPLHYAAAQGWTRCMRILHDVNTNLIDVPNQHGDTALHLAAKNGRVSAVKMLLTLGSAVKKNKEEKSFFDYVIESKESEVATSVVQHERWEEILLAGSSQYGCLFLGLIEHMPSTCVLVLDRCQTFSEHDKRSPDYYVSIYLCPMYKNQQNKRIILQAMVRHGRVDCLSHPVCASLLKLKWNTYGLWAFLLILGLYSIFLACLTYFVVTSDSLYYKTDNSTILSDNENHGYDPKPAHNLCLWIVAVYCMLGIIKEMVQMITQKTRYFADKQNLFEWILYMTSLVFTAPFLLGCSYHWQWEAGSLAVFFAWFNFLVVLQRLDFFGIYVVMFLEILSTLLQALCVFSVLFVAFGLSFFILLSHESTRAYSSPLLSVMRTAMMMLEIDYMASFNEPYTDGDDSTLHYGVVTMLMVVIFVILMPILLINLLIGLAVGDIESVQRDARLKRLAGQVALHSDMESKMPLWLLSQFDQPVYKFFPNRCRTRMANLWSRVSGSDLEDQAESANDGITKEIAEELHKQKKKLRDVSASLDKSNHLLRLIVQKMEIHTEDEVWDEGQSLTCRTT
ncbi:hypothetical protein C0Q70_16676 [Pomacea canaliculata]|uniref:Ion transport domain-containing protein n=1 Tax=Pomacea canaliculata TaxID=400727 RepID=A0A2T7NQF8_POMCA|nr:hypothetical protein C0Q70_16676 [Pomacea canaliculata]